MKLKKIFTICLVIAMVLMCCACTNTGDNPGTSESSEPEELTATQIAEKMQEALNNTPCGKLETTMEMAFSMDAGESGKMDMSMTNKTETTYSQNPVSSYSVATVDTAISGQTAQSVMENYTVNENNEMVSYVFSNGIWMKVPTGQSAEDYAKTASTLFVDSSTATIDETVTQWNGKEVITLRFELTGEELQKNVDAMLSIMGDMGGALDSATDLVDSVDYTKLKCTAIVYLDPETYLPMCEEQVFEGMTEVMAPLMNQLGVTVEVTTCTATAEFATYDAQEAVVLPEGVSEKAKAWTRLLANEPDNGDGTFTIREGMALIDLVHPEGFEVTDKDYDHVTFKRDDYRQITYMMSYITGEQALGSGEYFLQENDESEERWTTLGGGKVDREQMPVSTDTLTFTCDILATTWETGRQDANFYAWTALANDGTGTYYLYIEITDGYNDGMGFSKNADITSDEFVAYLNAAAPSKLTSE